MALEQLLVKKAQASTAVSTAPSTDNFPGEEAQSSTSFEDDEEDDVPPFPSSSLHNVPSAASTAEAAKLAPEGFGGACPCIPTAAAGSGHRKKVFPHHSTRT